jgi:hypothetical protein
VKKYVVRVHAGGQEFFYKKAAVRPSQTLIPSGALSLIATFAVFQSTSQLASTPQQTSCIDIWPTEINHAKRRLYFVCDGLIPAVASSQRTLIELASNFTISVT